MAISAGIINASAHGPEAQPVQTCSLRGSSGTTRAEEIHTLWTNNVACETGNPNI